MLTHTRDGGNSVRVAATCLYQYRPLTAIKDNSQSSPWSPYRLKSLASPPLESPFTSRCQIVCAKAVQQPCTYSGGISTALLKNSLTFSSNVCGGCLGSCVAFCFDRISSLSHAFFHTNRTRKARNLLQHGVNIVKAIHWYVYSSLCSCRQAQVSISVRPCLIWILRSPAIPESPKSPSLLETFHFTYVL